MSTWGSWKAHFNRIRFSEAVPPMSGVSLLTLVILSLFRECIVLSLNMALFSSLPIG